MDNGSSGARGAFRRTARASDGLAPSVATAVALRKPLRLAMALAASLALLAFVACGGDAPPPAALPTATPPPVPSPTPEATGLHVAMAVGDLSVGKNRFAFALIDPQSGPLRDAQVKLSTFFLAGMGPGEPRETVASRFRKWPVSAGGVYTAQLMFDTAGDWEIDIEVVGPGALTRTISLGLRIAEDSATPAIGSPAPRSVSRTAGEVAGLEEITSDLNPDPEMYAMSVADAIDAGMPVLVTFSTPAYCTSATCGPQLDVVKDLRRRYRDRMNFIHVEIYDNPSEIQGDLSRARISPVVTEWNLPSEPWAFVVDSDGLLHAKFEGFTTSEELEEALVSVLE